MYSMSTLVLHVGMSHDLCVIAFPHCWFSPVYWYPWLQILLFT